VGYFFFVGLGGAVGAGLIFSIAILKLCLMVFFVEGNREKKGGLR
jgi:hypothetical protein